MWRRQGRLRGLLRRGHSHSRARNKDQRLLIHAAARARQNERSILSDFLLHDIETGNGAPILPQPEYASTAPQIRMGACGLRNRLMHDGLSFTRQEAIQRHAGQPVEVVNADNTLTAAEQAQLVAYLDSASCPNESKTPFRSAASAGKNESCRAPGGCCSLRRSRWC